MPRGKSIGLTKSQRSMFDGICRYAKENGHSPSISEMVSAFGSNTTTIRSRILGLIDKGCIVRVASTRTFDVPGKSKHSRMIYEFSPVPDEFVPDDDKVSDDSSAPEKTKRRKKNVTLVEIPLLGTVVAGVPITAEENLEGYIRIDMPLSDPGSCFALKAQGESMIGVGIYSGDTLIVRSQPIASSGDIVIASINNELTVKTLYYHDRIVRLMPENRTMEPIPIGPEDDFRILGVVLNRKSKRK